MTDQLALFGPETHRVQCHHPRCTQSATLALVDLPTNHRVGYSCPADAHARWVWRRGVTEAPGRDPRTLTWQQMFPVESAAL